MSWSELAHAYGDAGDVPQMVRGLTSDDEGTAGEAEAALWGSVCHQGTVCSASVAVVPFLARLAADGVRVVGVLRLLSAIAECVDGRDPGLAEAARRAVADQASMVLPLLAADDAEVRSTAGWVLAQTRRADLFAGAVAERWEAEPDAGVRGDLLRALHVLAPERASAAARRVLGADQPPRLRLVAAYVLVTSGDAVDSSSEAIAAAATAWMGDASGEPGERPWRVRFQDVVREVLRAEGPGAAVALLAPALTSDPSLVPTATALLQVQATAEDLIRESRRATALLIPLLAPLVGSDPDSGLIREIRGADHENPRDSFAEAVVALEKSLP